VARLGGLNDEAACLRLEKFEIADVTVQLARVFADQLVAFAELEGVCESLCDKEEDGTRRKEVILGLPDRASRTLL